MIDFQATETYMVLQVYRLHCGLRLSVCYCKFIVVSMVFTPVTSVQYSAILLVSTDVLQDPLDGRLAPVKVNPGCCHADHGAPEGI